MHIHSMQSPFQLGIDQGTTTKQSVSTNQSFQQVLTDALSKVNEAQLQSSAATQAMARKEPIDLHEVMIAANKASVALQGTLEVRNKVIEAYQEMMRMQV
ncbi:flagellar hook-basal body complex protein FliE [Shouchella miscanthi]|uniref:flagellar hook-basal body complex protein FliE n=1 Tax=Shouchella miscanthi TaxID=2598861 RepID=UPI000761F3DA|nr:flagellar hook-basal body complex protein FliE [Shouchella miscanthi]